MIRNIIKCSLPNLWRFDRHTVGMKKEQLMKLLKPFQPLWRAWLKLGHVLGVINTTLILILFYFLVITPLGLIRKILGKDDLGTSKKETHSFWQEKVQRELNLETYSKQF